MRLLWPQLALPKLFSSNVVIWNKPTGSTQLNFLSLWIPAGEAGGFRQRPRYPIIFEANCQGLILEIKLPLGWHYTLQGRPLNFSPLICEKMCGMTSQLSKHEWVEEGKWKVSWGLSLADSDWLSQGVVAMVFNAAVCLCWRLARLKQTQGLKGRV